MTTTRLAPRSAPRALAAPRGYRRWWMLPAAAVLVALAVVAAGVTPRLALLGYLAAVTPALAAIDVQFRRLPHRLVLPGYAVGAVALTGQAITEGEVPFAALGAGAASFVLFVVFAAGGGMGFGDATLAGVLGLAAGSLGAPVAVASPVVAFVLGGAIAVTVLRGDRGAGIPFGPCLLAGFWVAVAVAPRLP